MLLSLVHMRACMHAVNCFGSSLTLHCFVCLKLLQHSFSNGFVYILPQVLHPLPTGYLLGCRKVGNESTWVSKSNQQTGQSLQQRRRNQGGRGHPPPRFQIIGSTPHPPPPPAPQIPTKECVTFIKIFARAISYTL